MVCQTPPRPVGNYGPRRRFTPLAEPLDVIFKHMKQHNMIVYPQKQPFDESKTKLYWNKENEYCAYHHVKGHETSKCIQIKHLVQDLIDQGKIAIDPITVKSLNANLGMYKNVLPKHQGEASTSITNQGHTTKNINYNNVPFDYGPNIGYISYVYDHVNMIRVKGGDTHCVVTTRRACMSVLLTPTSSVPLTLLVFMQ